MLTEHLRRSSAKENFDVDDKALGLDRPSRARFGAAMRCRLLDQAAGTAQGTITRETILEILGEAPEDILLDLAEAISSEDILGVFGARRGTRRQGLGSAPAARAAARGVPRVVPRAPWCRRQGRDRSRARGAASLARAGRSRRRAPRMGAAGPRRRASRHAAVDASAADARGRARSRVQPRGARDADRRRAARTARARAAARGALRMQQRPRPQRGSPAAAPRTLPAAPPTASPKPPDAAAAEPKQATAASAPKATPRAAAVAGRRLAAAAVGRGARSGPVTQSRDAHASARRLGRVEVDARTV